MFIRLARFEGADVETRHERAATLKGEIEAIMGGAVPEGGPPPEAAEVLRSSVKRVLVLADPDSGMEANAVFCETDEDLRRVDQILSAANPAEGDGHRVDLGHYEVLADVELSAAPPSGLTRTASAARRLRAKPPERSRPADHTSAANGALLLATCRR